jgi:hypothetical protein
MESDDDAWCKAEWDPDNEQWDAYQVTCKV